MNRLQRLLPWIVAVCVLAYVVSLFARGGHTSTLDWAAIGRIPVSSDGRVKPLDTFARNSLMVLSGRQTFVADGERAPAIQWLLELTATPSKASERRVFRIDNPDVLALLALDESKGPRFSFGEITPKLDEIIRQTQLASQVPANQRDPFQRQVLELENRLVLYHSIVGGHTPYAVAPLAPAEEWRSLAVASGDPAGASHPSVAGLNAILQAFALGQWADVNARVAEYRAVVGDQLPGADRRAGYEVIFNRFEPFYQAAVLYVLAFILSCVGFLLGSLSRPGWSRSLARATLCVLAVAFTIHTLGIASRIYLQGRPPVTNLYSSAVFIGWVCIPLAMAAERFSRLGLGSVVASLIGFATLVVAHNLTSGGDTMEMMQAVLDSNFWLSTHVVVITIGYSATFLAGFIAAAYLLLGVLTPLLKAEALRSLPRMTYGIVAFASVTSFVGTVLGGIWADQSWGRFWGWDPKENGAALIVLWNVLILHARWGGMVRDRGVAVLAVGGNIVTAWSWFGTNMLGVGLHSYGFMNSAVFWLLAFAACQLAIMGIGLVPLRLWRSLRSVTPKTMEVVVRDGAGECTPAT